MTERERRDDPDAGHSHQSSGGLISLGQPSDSRIQCGLLVANPLMNRKQTFDDGAHGMALSQQFPDAIAELSADRAWK
jgi:hypothetical protein